MKITPFFHLDAQELVSNTYVIDDGVDCVVIDPSKDNDEILNFLEKHHLNLKGILITHGHADHISGVNAILKKLDVAIYIHFFDKDKLTSSYKNCSMVLTKQIYVNKEPISVSDNEILRLLKEPIKVIETPFHTNGSVCYYLKNDKILFTGDSLFFQGYGRYDLPTGDHKLVRPSLEKIFKLPLETVVYPGHGRKTTLNNEKNLYF